MYEDVHQPVMVHEVLAQLNCKPHGNFVDCTVGGGGHAEAILEATAPDGRLLGFDRDEEILGYAKERLKRFGDRVTLCHGRFDQVLALFPKIAQVNGVLFDLGVSSLQLDQAERGFSFSKKGVLDMRMDRSTGESAGELLARLSEFDLVRILKTYGEERFARRISRGIVKAREKASLATTEDLAALIFRTVPPFYRHSRVHPATRTFQALRIVVNQELEFLEKGLLQGVDCLVPAGRICVLSFHSLEDRVAKHCFRALDRDRRTVRVLSKRPLRPSPNEILVNPRARSAKMRVAERR